jgi:hypothetical protein
VTLTRPVGGAIRLLKRSWQAIVGEIFKFSVAVIQKANSYQLPRPKSVNARAGSHNGNGLVMKT